MEYYIKITLINSNICLFNIKLNLSKLIYSIKKQLFTAKFNY